MNMEGSEIHSLKVCENEDATETFEQSQRNSGLGNVRKTDSGSEMCRQKEGHEQRFSIQKSQSPTVTFRVSVWLPDLHPGG